MNRRSDLIKILKTLSSSHYSVTTLSRLAKQAGFKTAADTEFKKCLERLKRDGVIDIQQSGFKGDSMHHNKIVVLSASLMVIDEEKASAQQIQEPIPILSFSSAKEKQPITNEFSHHRIPQRTLLTRFFQLIRLEHFSKAEEKLERLKKKMPRTEWYQGYFKSLCGILLAAKSKDKRYAFLPTLDLNNKRQLHHHLYTFIKESRKKHHAEYEQGFFSAWASFMRALIKTRP